MSDLRERVASQVYLTTNALVILRAASLRHGFSRRPKGSASATIQHLVDCIESSDDPFETEPEPTEAEIEAEVETYGGSAFSSLLEIGECFKIEGGLERREVGKAVRSAAGRYWADLLSQQLDDIISDILFTLFGDD